MAKSAPQNGERLTTDLTSGKNCTKLDTAGDRNTNGQFLPFGNTAEDLGKGKDITSAKNWEKLTTADKISKGNI
jgi:hypothetical protein